MTLLSVCPCPSCTVPANASLMENCFLVFLRPEDGNWIVAGCNRILSSSYSFEFTEAICTALVGCTLTKNIFSFQMLGLSTLRMTIMGAPHLSFR